MEGLQWSWQHHLLTVLSDRKLLDLTQIRVCMDFRVERIPECQPFQRVARECGEYKLRKTNISKLSTILNRWSHIGCDCWSWEPVSLWGWLQIIEVPWSIYSRHKWSGNIKTARNGGCVERGRWWNQWGWPWSIIVEPVYHSMWCHCNIMCTRYVLQLQCIRLVGWNALVLADNWASWNTQHLQITGQQLQITG